MFVGRKHELKSLNERYKEKGFQNIVIYGRRRVGKTTLVQEFLNDKKGTYFLSQKTTDQPQKLVNKFCKENNIYPENVKDFQEAFEFISKNVKNKYIIAIDEFPYLIEQDKTIPSQFQYIIDEILKKTNIYLILLGSSVSVMENEVLAHKSPLYGRRTGQIHVKSLELKDLADFFKTKNMEELIDIYSVFDSIPSYIQKINPKLNIYQNIEKEILEKESFLYEEVNFLLNEELREPHRYKEILKSISKGKTRLSEISQETGIDKTVLTKYMKTLETLEIIKKEYPVQEKELKRNSIYAFKDNFFKFYFTFIYSNLDLLETRKKKIVLKEIKKNLAQYQGKVFEEVCIDHVRRNHNYKKVGRYWKKGTEVDLIALNEETLIGECKYQDNVREEKIIEELKHKELPFKNKQYKVFAKSFKDKNQGIDLKDIYKGFKQ